MGFFKPTKEDLQKELKKAEQRADRYMKEGKDKKFMKAMSDIKWIRRELGK